MTRAGLVIDYTPDLTEQVLAAITEFGNSGQAWRNAMKRAGLVLDRCPELTEQVLSGDLARYRFGGESGRFGADRGTE